MRSQLQKFTTFTNNLLPIETEYLLSIEQFEDEDRRNILQQIDYNARHIDQFTPYDTSIDKRKYNHLQNWISARLKAIDVDEHFNQLLDWEQKIMTDSIRPEHEKQLLKTIRRYQHPGFFFSRFYELIENYRHFLLIRLRHSDHQLADEFLKKYRAAYLQSRAIKEKLHEATLAIVGQYRGKEEESKQWQGWLSEVFYDEKVEGQIRFLALVRLVFIAHNYRAYDQLRNKFDYLDNKFAQGLYYSKRHAVNYYNSRLMLHSNSREYDKAVYYGYLSIRAKTHDHLLYVNNLCAILLRMNRNQEALQLMQKASGDAKKVKNFHNRIGFVAFYMEALNKTGLCKNAEQYGDSFLHAYSKEILQYRWHLFFSVYLEAMSNQNHFEKVLKTAKKYGLQEKVKSIQSYAGYMPSIPLFIAVAQYREGIIPQKKFISLIEETLCGFDVQQNSAFKAILEDLRGQVPEIAKYL